MTGAARLEAAVRAANAAGRPAVAPFVTAGYPARAGFASLLETIASEADIVELGVPFSDPLADGVTIQQSSRQALERGVTLDWILELLCSRVWPAPIVLMSYLNPLLARGIERVAHEAHEAGVAGLIVPDLPYEESLPLADTFDRAELALVQLVCGPCARRAAASSTRSR
jgi:tryptophan synthase alpha chain